jgi:hypothetical protein
MLAFKGGDGGEKDVSSSVDSVVGNMPGNFSLGWAAEAP